MTSLLEIRNLRIDFQTELGVATAVENISFSVARGEILGIVGESGSGKSVTALSVLQLLPSSAIYPTGQIIFHSDSHQFDILKLSHKQLQSVRGDKIGMIFQEPMTSLNPVFTCGDQVMETIMAHERISRRLAKRRTLELFERVKLPEPKSLFHRYPHQLSGGQKQRVMIAMAMSCQPELLICDEPTTALDVTVQKTILELIRELQKQENMGVIFITHDLGVVNEIADRVVVMYRGRVVEDGRTGDVFSDPVHAYTKGLIACRPILHKKSERLPTVSDFLEGRSGIVERHQAPKIADETLIDVKNLNVWFPARKKFFGHATGYVKAVNDVSFSVFRGETLGLVGESGCGKTTLGRTLLRLINPTSGHIMYNGMDLTTLPKQKVRPLRKDFQIIFQDPYSSLNPRLTVGDALLEPLYVHRLGSFRKRKDRVIELLERVQLKSDHFNRYPHEFSGGQRQRIVIARALIMEPSFLVCDESVSALDVSVQAQILNLLSDLKAEFNFTSIFISHDLSVVHYISDRIMVMNAGKIEEIGPADDVFYRPATAYTQQLISAIPGAKVA